MKSVKEIFQTALVKSIEVIPKTTYTFEQKNNDGKVKVYSITPEDFKKSLKNKFGSFDAFKKNIIDHIEGQKNIIVAFASTPTSFSDAWNMKAEELIAEDVMALSNSGGHFQFNQIPYGHNQSGSALYQNSYAKGLVHSKEIGLIKGFRHKTGGIYEEDSLSEMGVFKYATPNIASGMMEYRFAEKFSYEIGIPLVYIITQWFRYNTKFEKLNNWIYMTGVAKVVSNKNHPHNPIELQLINKDEAIKLLHYLLEAMQTKGDFTIRPPMSDSMRLTWSYTRLKHDKEKRNTIIEYAKKNNLKCPGDECNNIFFKDLKRNKDFNIGHRISQNWNSQNAGVADVHHPYNLYLSCEKCNKSLGKKYPSEIDELINNTGTIGDWLVKGLIS